MDIFDMPRVREYGKKAKRRITDEQQEEKAAYMPTPAEIAAECVKIRAERKSREDSEIKAAISELVRDD